MRIRGLEGLGGLGLGCEWLAGLVWEGLGCVGFVYKIVEITAVGSNNGGGRVIGLLCMGRNGAGSNLAVTYHIQYRRLWLISACAYSGKRNVTMRLIKDMRLYGT